MGVLMLNSSDAKGVSTMLLSHNKIPNYQHVLPNCMQRPQFKKKKNAYRCQSFMIL